MLVMLGAGGYPRGFSYLYDADDFKVWTANGDGAVHVGGSEHIAAGDEAVHRVAEK